MTYYVYFMVNKNDTVIYTGVTSNLEQRVFDHKVKRYPKSFTARYNCDKLVYYEEFCDVQKAIHREKQVKRYHREWKESMIEESNPDWKDLSEGWYDAKEFQMFKEFDK